MCEELSVSRLRLTDRARYLHTVSLSLALALSLPLSFSLAPDALMVRKEVSEHLNEDWSVVRSTETSTASFPSSIPAIDNLRVATRSALTFPVFC